MAQAEKMNPNAIHVMLAFDDAFWAPAYAVMRSICLATRRRKDVVFHLLTLNLRDDHRADFDKIGAEFGAERIEYRLEDSAPFKEYCAGLPTDTRLNQIMYARLLVELLIPQTVSRIVYLDCDTYVRGPIEDLAECDLEGHPIAAVEEPHADFITRQTDMRHNPDLFDPADPYFNSGLLVIDTKAWRASGVLETLKRFAADGTMNRIYYDQDFLNLVFKDNWKKLDQLWNIVDPRQPHQALNPKMLHYTGSRRPWKLWSRTAFARTYRHVMTNELFYRYMRYRAVRRLKKWLRLG